MKKLPKRILCFRFSSLGDVAMTVPVMRSFQAKYPKTILIIVTKKGFESLFKDLDAQIIGVDFGNYSGLWGLFRLFLGLKKLQPDAIADFHQVLRTKVLKTLFKTVGVPSVAIEKGRADKKALTQRENKTLLPLTPTIERYQQVFEDLGFSFDLIPMVSNQTNRSNKKIGVAPFARYAEKTYPLEQMEKVVLELADKGFEIYLFGGKEEKDQMEFWTKNERIQFPKTKNLEEEIDFIGTLDLMISMDSANMHLAAMKGIPVVSVWGATHPFAGFLGYGLPMNSVVQNEELNCRPCSVFGNKPCFRGDLACMQSIPPSKVVDKVLGQI